MNTASTVLIASGILALVSVVFSLGGAVLHGHSLQAHTNVTVMSWLALIGLGTLGAGLVIRRLALRSARRSRGQERPARS